MPRKKHFTEKQNGLLSLTTRVDVNLTQEERLLLGYIIKEYSTRSNFLKENGYVHASVRTIKKECGLGQDTIEQARIKLENEGLITCEVGKAGVQNTRFSLTEKTKKYIYVPIDEKSVPISVPIDEKVHDGQTKRIESLELRINELIEDKKRLTEEIENLKKYIGIGVGIEQSCNSSCIHLSNLNNSTQNTIPDKSCSMSDEKKDTGSEYTQPDPVPYVFDERYFDSTPEPVKRKKKSSAVSSSLQIIEEENHPDTGDNDSSNEDMNKTDRFTLSQLRNDENPPQVALDPPLKKYEEVLGDLNQWVDLTVDEQISKEDENKKLLNEASRRRGFDIVDEVHKLMWPKAIELGERYPDHYDTYKHIDGFKPLGEFIKEAESRILIHLKELYGQKEQPKQYPELENTPIIVREAT